MDSFFQILYVPFGFLFRILFNFVGNYGLALVIFTLFFRLILLPSAVKQQKGMAKQYRLQPKLKRIREKYQDYAPNERNQKIQMETNELYQQEGYSAMSAGCLPMLLQLPILWGLYGIIRMPLTHVLGIGEEAVTALTTAVQSLGETSARTAAYAESLVISRLTELLEANPDLVTKFPEAIQKIQAFDFRIFGIDLGTIPSTETFRNWAEASTEAKLVLLIPILSGITSLMTSVLSQVRQKKTNPDAQMQGMGCMMLSMPLMSLWFTFQFPAGMGMYWILSNVFAFFQTLILGHFYAPRKTVAQHMVAETIERRSYEKAKKSAADKEKNEQN